MKKFEAPSLEIIEFDDQDIIATSSQCPSDNLPICISDGGGMQLGCGTGSDMLCSAW